MKNELENVLHAEMKAIREKSYNDLKDSVLSQKVDAYEVNRDGKKFAIEFQYFWDSEPDGNIRVIGSINEEYSWSSFRPLSADFIKAPNGEFVGE